MMHATRLAPGNTLDKLRRRLACGPATTMELQDDLYLVAPATWVSMLRQNGVGVICRYLHTTSGGRRVYEYRLDKSR